MRKLYFGMTKEQIIILSLLTASLLIGVILRKIKYDAGEKAYLNFRSDSALLAAELKNLYSDSIFHSEAELDSFIDSLFRETNLRYSPEKPEKMENGNRAWGKTQVKFPIELNSATLDELCALDGIGPKTAQKIIEYRKESGPFTSVKQLLEIKGIGPKKLARIENKIYLGSENKTVKREKQ